MIRSKLVLLLFSFAIASCARQETEDKIKWDFSKFDKLTFSYKQIAKLNMVEDSDDSTVVKGNLILSVNKKHTADLVFKNIKMVDNAFAETEFEEDESVPDFFITGVTEEGKIEGDCAQRMEMFAQTLFPIPNKRLNTGSRVKIPVEMPFNIAGSRIMLRGYNMVRLDSIRKNIAYISTIIDISEFDVPTEADFNYEAYTKGTSHYEFDMSGGHYRKASIYMQMGVKEGDPDQEKENKMKRRFMSMDMDYSTQIELKLLEVD